MSDTKPSAPVPPTELGRYRILSSTAGIRVSPLQLGAMSIGDAWSNVLGSTDKTQSFKLLDAFVEAGGNFIDTASNYQNEQSEEWIGEWMAERGNRDQLVIATKYTSNYRSYAVGKGKAPNSHGNHRRCLHVSVRDSLKKLRTDWIDILYLHFWDYTTSIEEVIDSLHVLVQQGKVLYLGISDTPAWIVAAANEYAKAHGKTPFSVYQGRWNVLRRDFEREIIPMARHYGMALAPWDVLGGGHFKTKEVLKARQRSGEGVRSFMGGVTEAEERISAALEKVAEEHGIKSLTAVAIAYVMAKTTNVFPIIGGRKVEYLHDNIQALKMRLTPEQIAYLENSSPLDIGFPTNFIGEDPHVKGESGPDHVSSAPMAWVKYPKSIDQA
ncbi:hypothetical protein BFW01_g10321 [Lasiodiplodia theobromae]|uniref:Aldo-keto reductase ausK n=1 Tax=Lasiodiplodia theobromae TaxID=45133 RepID=A0A5N5D4L0_9PEZI|nr:putative aryl-alcohol dehydrogenase AAD14 [Lasiodiplodia theobromae]KAF9629118.1 hypothetical protein BFW01_g10321 [Lasiodiplodia theobromae]